MKAGHIAKVNYRENPMTSTTTKGRTSLLEAQNPRALKAKFISLLRDNSRAHRIYKVFADFCEMSAISISNAFDKAQYEKREARYLQIVAGYSKEEVYRFAEMLGVFTLLCETGFRDHLGEIFMELDMGDDARGQFFTPYEISSMMAQLTLTDARSLIEQNGYITINEPACGAGGMVLAAAEAVQGLGVNYQQHIHVTAQDIDAQAVHMTYIQLALFHVPGVVLHGNTLSLETWGHWVTPAHVMGAWDLRLHRRFNQAEQVAHEVTPVELPALFAVDGDSKPLLGGANHIEMMGEVVKTVVNKRVEQLDLF